MQKRFWWKETFETNRNLNFRWQQTMKGIFWDRYTDKANQETSGCFNHFEYVNEIGNKEKLMGNLISYCIRNDIYVYNFVPLTLSLRQDWYETDLS